MEVIKAEDVKKHLSMFFHKEVYVHLETTNGAYASHFNDKAMNVGAFIRNARVNIQTGKIIGQGPYRVGLQVNDGWVYAEGLTHYELDEEGRLLLAGHDDQGRLAVALQLSEKPFT